MTTGTAPCGHSDKEPAARQQRLRFATAVAARRPLPGLLAARTCEAAGVFQPRRFPPGATPCGRGVGPAGRHDALQRGRDLSTGSASSVSFSSRRHKLASDPLASRAGLQCRASVVEHKLTEGTRVHAAQQHVHPTAETDGSKSACFFLSASRDAVAGTRGQPGSLPDFFFTSGSVSQGAQSTGTVPKTGSKLEPAKTYSRVEPTHGHGCTNATRQGDRAGYAAARKLGAGRRASSSSSNKKRYFAICTNDGRSAARCDQHHRARSCMLPVLFAICSAGKCGAVGGSAASLRATHDWLQCAQNRQQTENNRSN